MRPLIAANWKMNGEAAWVSKPDAFEKLLPASKRKEIDVLICPPMPFLAPLYEKAKKANIHIGAQNCHSAVSGAHTGEVSAEMLKSVGTSFVIVGHSERRAMGETDADVKAKAEATLRAGLTPIICVGEPLELREKGEAERHVGAQLAGSLPEVRDGIVVAYEPIWAIGTGKVAELEDIKQMHDFMRKTLGVNIRLLYGGSVKPANAKDILKTDNVNGALIGGASLEMESLAEIAKAAL